MSGGMTDESGDALAEWRSSEQVENGIPSTSPPYWDSDDSDDDDGGPKPVDLYGKYTWKIEKFSQINKRELRSNAFEVGGYKWYILIYPQGCDVCNHLSLFLCVANHDKLLPGWSHFAQFTIAVVNKDPKKSKYSDTLHRFWKKEHDWGWKKFMELSKVSDGFVDADTLIIKAQVQVIRERADRPFRCLDCQYRRELVRVYLTNVEQICRRFVEERRGKLGKMIEDKARWSSFCAFWLGMDQSTRRRMSREKKEMILKVVVKHFFVDKEVTSTLVMDSLYSGLKALEGLSNGKKGKSKLIEGEDSPSPIVQVEKDMFVLVDDVLLLLERAAVEPLPPKDDKGPQNRTKDGGTGEEFNKDSIERDERRLTELGRRTVEIFVLAHIFSSKIEVAYQEAVALKRQEELIREEEAACLVENEKAKRSAGEKDKKTKKKQGKQKRSNRKGKDKMKEDKGQEKDVHEDISNGIERVGEKDDGVEYGSDVSDSVEMLRPESEDRDASPVNWDTDTSEIQPSGSEISSISTVQNGVPAKRPSSSFMDDSSSTCSTDSAPSLVFNASSSYRFNSFKHHTSPKSPSRGKSHQMKGTCDDYTGGNEADRRLCEPMEMKRCNDVSPSCKAVDVNDSQGGAITCLQDKTKWPELNAVKKQEDEQKKISKKEKEKGDKVSAKESTKSPPRAPIKRTEGTSKQNSVVERVSGMSMSMSMSMSRPLSAPLITSTAAPMMELATGSAPLLSRSSSAAGRLGPDPAHAHPYIPQSFRNVIVGPSSSTYTHPHPHPRTHTHSTSSSAFSPLLPFQSPLRDSQSSMLNDMYGNINTEFSVNHAATSGRQVQNALTDEFPHLDIINDLLLDDDQGPTLFNHHDYPFSNSVRDFIPHSNSWQGQLLGPDGYLYGIPEYSNIPSGVNGYAMFPPSNM